MNIPVAIELRTANGEEVDLIERVKERIATGELRYFGINDYTGETLTKGYKTLRGAKNALITYIYDHQ